LLAPGERSERWRYREEDARGAGGRGNGEEAAAPREGRRAARRAGNGERGKPSVGRRLGRRRLAFERGDHGFQYSIDVMSQQAIIVKMIGSATAQTTNDPVAI